MNFLNALYIIICIAFIFVGYKNIVLAISLYLPLKLFLLKSMVLVYIPNLPLITLDRVIFLELIILIVPSLVKKKTFVFERLKQFPFKIEFGVLLSTYLLVLLFSELSIVAQLKGVFSFLYEEVALVIVLWFACFNVKEITNVLRYFALAFIIIGIYGIVTKIMHSNPYIDLFLVEAAKLNNDNLIFTYIAENRFGIESRIQSVMFHPIAYSGFLALSIPVFYNYYLNTKFTIKSFTYLGLVYLLALNIVYANSRIGLLTLGFAMISSVILFTTNKDKKRKFFISLIAILIVGLFFIPRIPDGLLFVRKSFFVWEGLGEYKGSTIADRIVKFDASIALLKNNIWFGNGIGATSEIVMSKKGDLGGAESVWYHYIIDLGLVGVLAYLFFYSSIFYKIGRQYLRLKKKGADLTKVITLFFILLAYFLFVTATGALSLTWYFLVLLTFGISYIDLTPNYKK